MGSDAAAKAISTAGFLVIVSIDFVIAASLSVIFKSRKTGIKRYVPCHLVFPPPLSSSDDYVTSSTDSVLAKLVSYTIRRGLIAVCVVLLLALCIGNIEQSYHHHQSHAVLGVHYST